MNKIYFCSQQNCNNNQKHDYHQMFDKETLEIYYGQLFQSNISLENEYFLNQIQNLQIMLEKIKERFLLNQIQENIELQKLKQNYNQFNPDWKILAEQLNLNGSNISIKLNCVEILLKISNLFKACEKFAESKGSVSKTKIQVRIKIPQQIQQVSYNIQEDLVSNMEIKTKLEKIIKIGSQTESMITHLHQHSQDSILVLFEDNSLVNFNLISKCPRQFAISCQSFNYENERLLVQYQDEFSLYSLDDQNKKFQLLDHKIFENIEWYTQYLDFIIFKDNSNRFYSYSTQNYSEQILLQLESNLQTNNIIQCGRLIISQGLRLIIHNLTNNISNKIQFDEKIIILKQHYQNYICIICFERFYVYDIVKEVIIKIYAFPHNTSFIYPSLKVPFLFIMVESGDLKQNKVYLHNTNKELAVLVSQNPTAVYQDSETIMIGDDLGYLQLFSLKIDMGIQLEN